MKLSIVAVCLLLTGVTNGFQPIVAVKKVVAKTPEKKTVTKSPAAPAKTIPVVPGKNKVTPVAPPKKK
jgi:hypothetical protein